MVRHDRQRCWLSSTRLTGKAARMRLRYTYARVLSVLHRFHRGVVWLVSGQLGIQCAQMRKEGRTGPVPRVLDSASSVIKSASSLFMPSAASVAATAVAAHDSAPKAAPAATSATPRVRNTPESRSPRPNPAPSPLKCFLPHAAHARTCVRAHATPHCLPSSPPSLSLHACTPIICSRLQRSIRATRFAPWPPDPPIDTPCSSRASARTKAERPTSISHRDTNKRRYPWQASPPAGVRPTSPQCHAARIRDSGLTRIGVRGSRGRFGWRL